MDVTIPPTLHKAIAETPFIQAQALTAAGVRFAWLCPDIDKTDEEMIQNKVDEISFFIGAYNVAVGVDFGKLAKMKAATFVREVTVLMHRLEHNTGYAPGAFAFTGKKKKGASNNGKN